MAIPYTLALQGSDDATFATTTDHTVKVLGVLPYPEPVNDNADDALFGFVLPSNATILWRWVLVVNALRYMVTADGTQDYGDFVALMTVLRKKYVRVVATGTDLPRSSTTGGTDHNFWTDETDGLLASPLLVKCTSWPQPSSNAAGGNDTVTFTLKAVYPHAAP